MNQNVIRKKVELLHLFKECETEESYMHLNNKIVLPLYETFKNFIEERCNNKDFSPVPGNYYFSDFNFLHDAIYFLENMHYNILSEISRINFIKNSFTILKY